MIAGSDEVCDLLNAYNTLHSKLQFMYKIEINDSLHILHITLKGKTINRIKAKWLRKPTCSDRQRDYNSYLPKTLEIGRTRLLKN